MTYVVEIAGPSGGKATKEYEATSLTAAVRLANLELRNYPKFQITDIRLKRDSDLRKEHEDWWDGAHASVTRKSGAIMRT